MIVIIMMTVLLSAACLSAGAQTWLRGDADGDGKITSLDVTTAQRVLSEIITDDDGSITRRCDVDGDGLSLPDVTAIQRSLASLPDDHHIGETVSDDLIQPTEDNQLPILTR